MAIPDDLDGIVRVYSASRADMWQRFGLKPPVEAEDESQATFEHLIKTGEGGTWVATDGAGVLGVAAGFVRGPVWFLADFWVQPGRQRQGIGARLFAAAYQSGMQRARVGALYASPDPVAQTVYLKAGFVPRTPVYALAADGESAARARDSAAGRLRFEPADRLHDPLGAFGRLDEAVRGCRRDPDHEFWLNRPGAAAWIAVRADGAPAAYFYSWADGRVGPLAVADEDHIEAVLASAIGAALGRTGDGCVRMRVPGVSARTLRFLMSFRFRVQGFGTVMSTAPFGRFDCYLPSGPALL